MGERELIMQDECGFFVVERINWFDKAKYPYIPDREPSLVGSHNDILRRYRGIEGSAWPDEYTDHSITLDSGLAPLSQQHLVHDYCELLGTSNPEMIVDCIVCMKVPFDFVSLPKQAGLRLLGFDYGYLVCDSNNYSVIFNEVIYGRYPQLTAFASSLNEHCLLPTLETVQSLQSVRLGLLVEGSDFETDEACKPFVIYEFIGGT